MLAWRYVIMRKTYRQCGKKSCLFTTLQEKEEKSFILEISGTLSFSPRQIQQEVIFKKVLKKGNI